MEEIIFTYIGLDESIISFLQEKVVTKEHLAECQIVRNVEDFLKIVEKLPPLILYDLDRPSLNIETVLSILKEHEHYPLIISISQEISKLPEQEYIFYIPKSLLTKPGNLVAILSFTQQNKDRIGKIFYTWDYQAEFLNHIPLGMYRTKANGEFIFANKELLNILEVPDFETLMSMRASQFYVNPMEREFWVNNIINQKIVRNFEFRLKTYKGNIKWIRNNARGIFQKGELLYIEGFLEDITEIKLHQEREKSQSEKALSQRLLLMELFKHRGYYLEDLTGSYKELLLRCADALTADRVGIWTSKDENVFTCEVLYDREHKQFFSESDFNFSKHFKYLNTLNQGIQISVQNVLEDPRLSELIDSYLIPAKIKTLIDTPIFVGDIFWGILKVEYKKEYPINREDEWFCHVVGFYISNLVESVNEIKAKEEAKNYLSKIEKAYDEAIGLISKILEERDPYTAGHQKKVALIAKAIAQEMGYSVKEANKIYIAGMLHDIGKLYVPAEILTKPAKLNPIEFELVKIHPQKGYETLKSMEYLQDIAEIIYQHHERLDGSGYPRGLKEPEILPEAKILAVADVVEAMLAHRPYRPRLKVEDVFMYLEKEKGKLFDIEVVEALKKIYNLKIAEITNSSNE